MLNEQDSRSTRTEGLDPYNPTAIKPIGLSISTIKEESAVVMVRRGLVRFRTFGYFTLIIE